VGLRLDLYQHRRYANTTRTLWQERIRAGQVRLEGQATRPGRRLKAGQRVEFVFWQKPEPEINTDYRVLFQDGDLICIDKPPDLPVHPSGIYREHTLYALLKRDFGADFTVHLVHRIDRETSGLLLLGGNARSAAALQRSFLSGAVHKEYLVLVEGDFPNEMDAEGWLGIDRGSSVRKKRRFYYNRKEAPTGAALQSARTQFWRVSASDGMSLVRCRLHTGRMHQIRATLRSIRFPVVGDRLYGVDDRLYLKFINDEETEADRIRLRMNRTALHSHRLELPHPATGKQVTFEARLPDDIARLIKST
jgi:23S rRNA pseudouridine955/2504/2580 synthase/23S rRNA pseudouridine1911/1915/1917 synthase